ncbi:UNVERIFIED_CONTAM: hypothetical protein GTU68_049996 [Idotea baltica]|nr:hypothetical protein [Idotea baltica]
MKIYTLLSILFFLSACSGLPQGVEPVTGFDANRYFGKWYEIARLDHSFERNMNNVTAEYSLSEDGNIKVVNRGYNTESKQWKTAEGKAKFVEAKNVGRLKVSFFGPFYGGYNIVELDKKNYQYAMIMGNNTKYFWILSRNPTLAPSIQNRLIDKAKGLKIPVDKLIYVEHDAK